MNKEMINLLIFMALCFVGYLIFRSIPFKEGMDTVTSSSSKNSGLGGDAATYAAKIKLHSVKHQDLLHINKYRDDYENSILHLDELVDHMMLKEALSVNHEDPMGGLEKISKLNGVKGALNNVMKFIDGK
jgi:hypothetical protein